MDVKIADGRARDVRTDSKRLPVSAALVHALTAFQMKYRLGYEDDGWRGEIGCEVVEGVRASRRGQGVQLNHRVHHAGRGYFDNL